MRITPQYEFDEKQHHAYKKARRLEWILIIYLGTLIPLMFLVMGESQAMKTAWIEDCLSLIPPVSFIISSKICWKKPTKCYPYGFHRVVSIFYLCASLALFLVGAILCVDALSKLVAQEHPTIGLREYFGADIWLGWWMILVLLWGAIPPIFLGKYLIHYSKIINDKILYTGGKMAKADWLTAFGAIIGILGVGLGLWWLDAAAALLISFDILKDGWLQLKDSVTGLINRAPTDIEGRYTNLPEAIINVLSEFPSAQDTDVRLYEHGHLIFGEGFIKVNENEKILAKQCQDTIHKVRALDWRLQDFTLTLITEKNIVQNE